MTVALREHIELWYLTLFTFIIVYFMPGFVSWFIFLFYAFLTFRSKQDYFWIAFFFLIFDGPGRLFLPQSVEFAKGIPSYGIRGMAVGFSEIIIFVSVLKVVFSNKKWKFIFKNDIIFLAFYLIFTYLVSIVNGISGFNTVLMLRTTIPLLLIFTIPFLLKTNEDFLRLDSLIFPLVFVAFASQIFTFFSGVYLVDYFRGSQLMDTTILLAGEKDPGRVYNSVYLLMYAFHKALFYFFNNKLVFTKRYLISIIIICFLSLFLSATRGWTIAFLVVFLLCGIYYGSNKKIFDIIKIVLGGLIIFLLLILFSPALKTQVLGSFERLSSVTSIAYGDLSAGGTSVRLTDRGERVLSKVAERPVLGWGFSDVYFEYWDGHVGHHSILLNVGIVGYLIFLFFLFKWLVIMFNYARRRTVQQQQGKSVYIFVFSLIFIFIVHSTSRQLWGFTLGDKVPSFFAIFLLLISFDRAITIKQ
jgi:hypothetical protein